MANTAGKSDVTYRVYSVMWTGGTRLISEHTSVRDARWCAGKHHEGVIVVTDNKGVVIPREG